jgi:hypothetical protein
VPASLASAFDSAMAFSYSVLIFGFLNPFITFPIFLANVLMKRWFPEIQIGKRPIFVDAHEVGGLETPLMANPLSGVSQSAGLLIWQRIIMIEPKHSGGRSRCCCQGWGYFRRGDGNDILVNR